MSILIEITKNGCEEKVLKPGSVVQYLDSLSAREGLGKSRCHADDEGRSEAVSSSAAHGVRDRQKVM
jgi:hypothetical protein